MVTEPSSPDVQLKHPVLRLINRFLAQLAALTIPALPVILIIRRHGSGFPVQDDWIIYILSFDYLINGDLTVLWASICDHRVVFSRILHFLEYTLLGDTRPLLYFAPTIQFVFALILLRRLTADYAFSPHPYGTLIQTTAWFFTAMLLFSPIQAWAFARSNYLEIYLLNLGSLIFIIGLTSWHLRSTMAGLVLALGSTPGWLALIPTTLLFLAFNLLVSKQLHSAAHRMQRFGAPLLVALITFAALYLYPFEHPYKANCSGYGTFRESIVYLYSNFGHVIGQYLSFLGFPVSAVVTVTLDGQLVPMYAHSLVVSRILGTIYVLLSTILVGHRLRKTRAFDFCTCYLSYTLILSFSITLTRTPLLGDYVVIINYAYSAYTVTGWAVMIFLLLRSFDSPTLPDVNTVLRNGLVLVLIVAGTLSYLWGIGVLLESLHGQKFLRHLYRQDILASSTVDARRQATGILFPAFPTKVIEGTDMLNRHHILPRNWLDKRAREGDRGAARPPSPTEAY